MSVEKRLTDLERVATAAGGEREQCHRITPIGPEHLAAFEAFAAGIAPERLAAAEPEWKTSEARP